MAIRFPWGQHRETDTDEPAIGLRGGTLSKAFELLQGLEREREISTATPAPANGLRVSSSVVNQDEISGLVQRVFRSPDSDSLRTVIFAGVETGDGCSSICTATAEGLARISPGTVCLVDGNFRDPSLHQHYQIDNRVGFAEAIMQPGPIRSFAQRIGDSNLWVLPSGSDTGNVQGLLNSEALRARLADLRSEFDHVLIDSPALSRGTDATLLGRLSDGMVLVLQSNTTKRETARNVTEGIRSANVRLLGAVLNKRTFPIPQRLYARL